MNLYHNAGYRLLREYMTSLVLELYSLRMLSKNAIIKSLTLWVKDYHITTEKLKNRYRTQKGSYP